MAMRGSAARRLPGNPLGGLLRDIDRRTRTTTSRRSARLERPAPEAAPPQPAPAAAPPAPAPAPSAVGVVVTGLDGRARWTYPEPHLRAPVLTAVAVDPEPGAGRPVFAVLEEVAPGYAVVRVWRTRPRRGQGVVDPVGAGLAVHLTATAPTG